MKYISIVKLLAVYIYIVEYLNSIVKKKIYKLKQI